MFSLTAQQIASLRLEARYLRVKNALLDRARLAQKSRADKLQEENRKLKRLIWELKDHERKFQEEMEKIKKQRDTYKGMVFKPKVTPQVEKQSGLVKKLGGQQGHVGASRKLPAKIDQRVKVFFKSCPHCQAPLKRANSFQTHTVEDIPNLEQIKTLVVEYRLERQWCDHCHQEVVAKPALIIPHSRVGLNLIIQILIFKYVCRMTFEIIVTALYQTYGISLTTGGIIDILKRTKKFLGKDYGHLLQAIRSSPTKHADETGWRIKGLNSWLWAVLTKQEVYYTVEETRGKGVAENTLAGSKETDVLIRDDYAGYKRLPLKQQSCWAHLLRKSKEEVEQPNSSQEIQDLHQTLKASYQELSGIISQTFNKDEREQAYQDYSQKIQAIANTTFKFQDAQRVQVRIKNQGNNLITALLHEGVPLTNNLAERQIRPAVIIRKISGGSRSNLGAEVFATNFSVIQTIRMRNQPLIPTLQNMLLKGAAGKY